jgi:Domain of unknown function (DUF5666)
MRKVSVFALASLMTLGATAVMAQATPSTSTDKPATTSGSMSKKTATTTTKKTTTHAMSAKGAVTAMDATAKTLTVGSNTYTVTDTTKYMAHGKKAMMTDVKVGDTVSVSYTKDGDTMTATKVTVTKAAKM